jgi:hypothetical protein
MNLDEMLELLLDGARGRRASREEPPWAPGAYAKLRHALRTVRDGGSATFIQTAEIDVLSDEG